mmetsp:Transcript_10184/g.35667  ORF Transcript_10184/g.35667 Transcript_10184/m.35667 type:complete len:258 (-) Transcript_10184:708-1481(-)
MGLNYVPLQVFNNCLRSFCRRPFSPGAQRWQNLQSMPLWQRSVRAKAQGLQVPRAWKAEPTVGKHGVPSLGAARASSSFKGRTTALKNGCAARAPSSFKGRACPIVASPPPAPSATASVAAPAAAAPAAGAPAAAGAEEQSKVTLLHQEGAPVKSPVLAMLEDMRGSACNPVGRKVSLSPSGELELITCKSSVSAVLRLLQLASRCVCKSSGRLAAMIAAARRAPSAAKVCVATPGGVVRGAEAPRSGCTLPAPLRG